MSEWHCGSDSATADQTLVRVAIHSVTLSCEMNGLLKTSQPLLRRLASSGSVRGQSRSFAAGKPANNTVSHQAYIDAPLVSTPKEAFEDAPKLFERRFFDVA